MLFFPLCSCFISDLGVFIGTFLMPIILVMIFNSVMFVLAIRVIIKSNINKHKYTKSDQQKVFKTTFKAILSITGVMILFGLTWLFGALTIGEASNASQYLFVICNAFQGFFFFVFICIISKDGRELWMYVITFGRFSEQRSTVTRSKLLSPAHAHSKVPTSPVQTLSSAVRSNDSLPRVLQQGGNGKCFIEMSAIFSNDGTLDQKPPISEAEVTLKESTSKQEAIEEEESNVKVMEVRQDEDGDTLEFVILVDATNTPDNQDEHTPTTETKSMMDDNVEFNPQTGEMSWGDIMGSPSTKDGVEGIPITSKPETSAEDNGHVAD